MLTVDISRNFQKIERIYSVNLISWWCMCVRVKGIAGVWLSRITNERDGNMQLIQTHAHTWCWAHVRSLQRRWKAFISSKCSFFYWNIDGCVFFFYGKISIQLWMAIVSMTACQSKQNIHVNMFCWNVSFHVDHKFDTKFQWTTWIHLCGMQAIRWRTLKYRVNIRVARCIVAPIDEGCITAHTWSTNQFWTMHCMVRMTARAGNAHKRIINEFSMVQWNDHEATGFHTLSFVLLTFLLRKKKWIPLNFLKNDISKELPSLKSRRQNENYKIQLKCQQNSIKMQ